MTLADASELDAAIIARLANDPALKALLPGGVWMDQAPPGLTQFAILSVVVALDEGTFPGVRAVEDTLYLAKAVELSTVPVKNIKAAAARIDALLENASLTVTGYAEVSIWREERVRTLEVDSTDSAIRWQHRGGHYRVFATPAAS